MRTVACDAASSTLKLGAPPMELESLLRAYVDDIPASVVSIIARRGELVGPSGSLEPFGVIAGMAFARATRASFGALLKCPRASDRWIVSCMLCALTPSPKEAKSPLMGYTGFDDLVDKDMLDLLHGLIPAQPGDRSRL